MSHILIYGYIEDHLFCDYFHTETWEAVQSSEIMDAAFRAAKPLKINERGIEPDLIGSHSMREGCDMSLNIMCYNNSTIRKFGRWKSYTWKIYIHKQISKLYEGVEKKMTTPVNYKIIVLI